MEKNLVDEITRYQRLYEQGLVDDAFLLYADVLLRAKQISLAYKICRNGLSMYPDSIRGRILMSRILMEMGHYDKARDEIESVLAVNPESFRALLIYLKILIKKKEFEHAQRILEKLRSLDPGSPEVKNLADSISKYARSVRNNNNRVVHRQPRTETTPQQRAHSLTESLEKEKEVNAFYIIPENMLAFKENIPHNILSAKNYFEKMKGAMKIKGEDEITSLIIESKDGIIIFSTLKGGLLVIQCSDKAHIGKIRYLLQQMQS